MASGLFECFVCVLEFAAQDGAFIMALMEFAFEFDDFLLLVAQALAVGGWGGRGGAGGFGLGVVLGFPAGDVVVYLVEVRL